MRHFLGSLFAIGLAAVAAIAATTAMLNTRHRIGPAATPTTAQSPTATPPEPDAKPAVPPEGKPATPGGTPDTAKPAAGQNAGAAAPAGEQPDEADKDPYEGIAPEELPPDLQYNADSSVSFPTNI
jgi:hypothetical protein